MAKTNIGRVSVVPKDEYSSTENYKRLDVVSSDGSMYISKKDNNIGNPLTDKNWWFKAVEKGEKGDKPVNGVDYNTPEEKEEFKNDVVNTATEEVEQNIVTIKEEAIQEFNSNASTKTNEYNDNTTTKLSEYNTNANSKVEEYNSNAAQKTNTFNENATTQTETFNNNATSKTNDFNSNASTKTDEFNTNYDEKLADINEASTSIEQERVISDGKYARALKTPVTDVESTQIYAENDVVDDLVVNGVELTQETREGYNQLNLEKYNYSENQSVLNGGSVSIENGILKIDGTNATANMTIKSRSIASENRDLLPAGKYYFGVNTNGYYESSPENLVQFSEGDVTLTENYYLSQWYASCNKGETTNKKLLLSNNPLNTEYEEYGASPSLDYPSEVEITKEQKISIFRKNILDTSKLTKDETNLAVSFEPKSDGGIKIYGTANNTWVSFRKQSLNVPIKQGTTIYSNYGKTEELMRDNNDIRPFFWFYDKDDKIMNANLYGSDFKVLPKDVYSIQFGIEHFNNGTTYDEDIYIELEISDKQPTQFQKYEAIDISIALENGFNGALKDYYNEIKKLDGKWYLVNKFARYVLDGVTVGKKVTAKRSKNNIDKYDVMLGTDKIYINTSKDYWKPTLGICNYLKSDKTYGTINDINSTYTNAIGFWKSGQDQMSFSTEKDRFASIDEANAYLKQLYDAGNPLEFYVLMSEDNYETIELPEEVKQELNKFKLYDDLNNVFIDNGSLSFKYNKSLLRALQEKDDEIYNLQSQIDEIKTLLSSTSTASLLLENLANDNESEVS